MILKKQILYLIICNLCIGLNLELITDGLSKPIYLCSSGNPNNDLFIAEQRGKIIRVNKSGAKKTFLDIRKKVANPTFPGDERGLLGMAFHPNYKKNGLFFLYYIDNDDNSIISKFKYDLEAKEFNETIIMKLKQPYSNHNGGQIEFGPDGYLYIGLGDGGSANDPHNNAQDLTNLFGKILRIDIDKKTYTVPNDNPFINDDNALNEIWAFGLRNPWRFSFDKINGTIIIADVGQNSWEEINFQKASLKGLNYGWSYKEGSSKFKEFKNEMDLIDPNFEYSSNANYGKTLAGFKQSNEVQGCSVTGGYTYYGSIEELYGWYIFGDYCTGKIWGLKKNDSETYDLLNLSEHLFKKMKKQLYISSFGIDNNNEIYIVNHTGSIYKIIN